MKKYCLLFEMDVGQSSFIEEVNLEGNILRRVYDLGFIPKTKVKLILKAPGGSPMAFFIKGSVVALRKSDAEKIKCILSSEVDSNEQ